MGKVPVASFRKLRCISRFAVLVIDLFAKRAARIDRDVAEALLGSVPGQDTAGLMLSAILLDYLFQVHVGGSLLSNTNYWDSSVYASRPPAWALYRLL